MVVRAINELFCESSRLENITIQHLHCDFQFAISNGSKSLINVNNVAVINNVIEHEAFKNGIFH